MSLRVLEAGLHTLVVDQGRPSYRSLGVPVGGAADRAALAIANALVGNPPDAAALEFCLAGPTLEAQAELACAIFGAPFHNSVMREGTPDRIISAGKSFTLKQGDRLQINGTPAGMRAYLAIAGGLQTEKILESRSSLEPIQAGMDLPSQTGRIHGRFLSAGRAVDSTLEVSGPSSWPPGGVDKWETAAWLRWLEGWFNPGPIALRVTDGLQASWFRWEDFSGQTMTVSPASNRMGLRLQGQPLAVPERELVSEPVCPGSVQVTRDGQCIVLGVDGQTIGGYPKIAQVISADFDHLGQLRPGDHVQFVQVTLEQAADLYRRRRAELNALVLRLRTSLGGFSSTS
jgi:antagonist of KipI